jgi:hypothetical protein
VDRGNRDGVVESAPDYFPSDFSAQDRPCDSISRALVVNALAATLNLSLAQVAPTLGWSLGDGREDRGEIGRDLRARPGHWQAR